MATKRRKASIEKTLLCATRFWGFGPMGPHQDRIPTLRAGVRHVVRKQGFTSAEIARAERKLVREGKLVAKGKGTGASLVLTDKGDRVSCRSVRLSPWTDAPYPGARLAGPKGKR